MADKSTGEGISRRLFAVTVGLVSLGASGPLLSTVTRAPGSHFSWVTLGTQGGPVPNQKARGEPANLLVREGEAYLVDAGDGAATRLVAAGANYAWLKGIFISHIHADHIGGLFAILALRLQSRITPPLTIYGPPGMHEIVHGLIAAMKPGADSGFGVPGEISLAPGVNLKVVELRGGDSVTLDSFGVAAVTNTHYSFAPGSPQYGHFESLSYRFALPDRSIVYTGDTGPSAAVETMAQGADLLVTEMIDLETTRKLTARFAAHLSQKELDDGMTHLRLHHLTTDEIGKLAAKAGVRKVVLTHIVGDPGPRAAARYVAEVRHRFKGPVVLARDMDRF